MKRQILLLLLAFVSTSVMTSCDDEDFRYQDEFERSYQKWLDFKYLTGDTYYYVTNWQSWTGAQGATTIYVEEGVIVSRTYEHSYYENGKFVESEWYSWTETYSELGTHDEGASLLTLDDVYEIARTDFLADRDDVEYYFEAQNDGMISSCGYIPDNCMDDCFVGINIVEIGVLGHTYLKKLKK